MLLLPRMQTPPSAATPDRMPALPAFLAALALLLIVATVPAPVLLVASLVVLAACVWVRLPLACLPAALRVMAFLLLLAWLPALWSRSLDAVWPALLATWRLLLMYLISRCLLRATSPASLAGALDSLAGRVGLHPRLSDTMPRVIDAIGPLRDRLQGALHALVLRGAGRHRYPWWWLAQLPRLLAILFLECERGASGTPNE